MAIIKAFKAVRPTRDKVALVTTRSYDIYGNNERKSILKLNPFSFLHILEPGFRFGKQVLGEERFKMVNNRFCEFKENDVFITDEKPTFYLHQKTYKETTFWGIIALSSIADCENNVIKKHEKTLKSREVLFGNYLDVTGFNAEPVLITYPDNELINSMYQKYKVQRAEYEFTTNKKRTHLLWLIDNDKDVENIEKEFKSISSVYIADGHHRTASSQFLSKKLNKENNTTINDEERYNFFMSYLIAESNLKISSFNRLVSSLNNLSKNEFLIRLDEYFKIENLGQQFYKPIRKHHFSMYLDGKYYKLHLRKTNYKINNPLDDLDSQLLYKTILQPILGIDDLSNDDRITYLPENLDQMQLKNEVDSGKYVVGFGLFPISISQLKSVANNNLSMPPKSTYIEPKLRTGLTIFQLK
ncbi:MAG: DUF1015 domain-containing protein [Flavobacteriaceae bacterium]|nr:DUF1015 domain-containing protein [Flavobacteriaceae bacterium]